MNMYKRIRLSLLGRMVPLENKAVEGFTCSTCGQGLSAQKVKFKRYK